MKPPQTAAVRRRASSLPLEGLEPRRLLAGGSFAYAFPIGAPPPADETAAAVAVDATGDVYVTGSFSGTVDFDPSSRRKFLATAGVDGDTYVAKYTSAGAFVWARRVNNTGRADRGSAIAVDPTGGTVFVGGSFIGTADFKPGKALYTLTSDGAAGNGTKFPDAFVWRLRASDGAFVSATRMGGAGDDAITAIAADRAKDAYVAGYFSGEVGFGTFSRQSLGLRDGFVARITSTNGVIFAERVGGTQDDVLNALSLDSLGNVLLAGTFHATATVDAPQGASGGGGGGITPGVSASFTSKGGADALVLKFNKDGFIVYGKQFGGPQDDQAAAVRADASNNVLVGGSFEEVADFDPSTTAVSNLSSAGDADAFLAKLSAAGTFVWARRAGGERFDAVRGITADASNNVYATGQFDGTVDFNPGAAVANLPGRPNFANGFVWKLNSAGNLAYARAFVDRSDGFCEGASIALDGAGNLFIAGSFRGAVDFDPGTGVRARTSGSDGSLDGFLAKLLA